MTGQLTQCDSAWRLWRWMAVRRPSGRIAWRGGHGGGPLSAVQCSSKHIHARLNARAPWASLHAESLLTASRTLCWNVGCAPPRLCWRTRPTHVWGSAREPEEGARTRAASSLAVPGRGEASGPRARSTSAGCTLRLTARPEVALMRARLEATHILRARTHDGAHDGRIHGNIPRGGGPLQTRREHRKGGL